MLYWIGLLFCLVAGAAAHAAYSRQKQKKARRLPRHLPLDTRHLVNQDELGVWKWLQSAFHDHQVLVKVSVIRFTTPRTAGQSERWHEMLNGVYPTFTICDEYGRVVGCVDVQGSRHLSQSQRELKQTLFQDCGIAFAVVRAGSLPTSQAMRAAFLSESDQASLHDGLRSQADTLAQEIAAAYEHPSTVPDKMRPENTPETALNQIREVDLAALAAARRSLRAKLELNRNSRFVNFDPLSKSKSAAPSAEPAEDEDDELSMEWQNSFIMPFEDSAPGPLRK